MDEAHQGDGPRQQLARLARRAAASVDGVVAVPDIGTPFQPGGRDGVEVYPRRDDDYEVVVRIVCDLRPLPPIADAVRTAVRDAAADSDAAPVGAVRVDIIDIREDAP